MGTYQHEDGRTQGAPDGSALDKVLSRDPMWSAVDGTEPDQGDAGEQPDEPTEPQAGDGSGDEEGDGDGVEESEGDLAEEREALLAESREDLEALASEYGIENPSGFPNKPALADAILGSQG